jgi:hypothetical protein
MADVPDGATERGQPPNQVRINAVGVKDIDVIGVKHPP